MNWASVAKAVPAEQPLPVFTGDVKVQLYADEQRISLRTPNSKLLAISKNKTYMSPPFSLLHPSIPFLRELGSPSLTPTH